VPPSHLFLLSLTDASNVSAEFAPKCRRTMKWLEHFFRTLRRVLVLRFVQCGIFVALAHHKRARIDPVGLWMHEIIQMTSSVHARTRVREREPADTPCRHDVRGVIFILIWRSCLQKMRLVLLSTCLSTQGLQFYISILKLTLPHKSLNHMIRETSKSNGS
jgi:hypothetical protein